MESIEFDSFPMEVIDSDIEKALLEIIPTYYINLLKEKMSKKVINKELSEKDAKRMSSEIFVFELVKGVNSINIDNTIMSLRLMFKKYPMQKNIFERIVSKAPLLQRPRAFMELCRFFDITHFKSQTELEILNDDVEKFIEKITNDKNVEQFGLPIINNYFDIAITFEAINIIKYLLLRYNIIVSEKICKHAVVIGNHEIIHLLEHYGGTFKNIHYNVFRDCSHFDIMYWGMINFGHDYLKKDTTCNSLYWSFITDNQFFWDSTYYDLTVVKDNFADINGLVALYNCLNIATYSDISFTFDDLITTIISKHDKMFDLIIQRIKFSEQEIAKITLKTFNLCLTSKNLHFIEMFYHLKPTIVLEIDDAGNNILHYLAKQSSKEVFNYIKSKIDTETFAKMMNVKNNKDETPLTISFKYDTTEYFAC